MSACERLDDAVVIGSFVFIVAGAVAGGYATDDLTAMPVLPSYREGIIDPGVTAHEVIGPLRGAPNDTDLSSADVLRPGLGAGADMPVAAITGAGAGHLSVAYGELASHLDKSPGSAGYASTDLEGLCRISGYTGRL